MWRDWTLLIGRSASPHACRSLARLACGSVALLSCGSVLLGCGSRSGVLGGSIDEEIAAVYPWEPGAGTAKVRTPPACIEDFRTLYEDAGAITTELAVSGGEVIFGVLPVDGTVPQIRALDIASPSGGYRVIKDELPYGVLSLEGDQLLFWAQDQLLRVPLAGGVTEVVVDARSSDPSLHVESVSVLADAVYWVRTVINSPQLEIWEQRPRDRGLARRIANLDRRTVDPQLLAATPELLILAGRSSGVALPLQGGDPQPLAQVPDAELAGVDGLGAYYVRVANRTPRGGRALAFELLRAPADGSPTTRFWARPAGHRLDHVWPVDSGWLATGAYYMFDGTPHAVIAHIDAAGNEALIACDRADNALMSRPVFWQGAFYAVTRADNSSRIVEIRLPE